MLVRIAFCCLTSAIILPAHADALSDKVCPLLEQIASDTAGKDAVSVQANLVMSIGGAYDFDGVALRDVTDNIDASAAASCAQARDTLLERLGMDSLKQALR